MILAPFTLLCNIKRHKKINYKKISVNISIYHSVIRLNSCIDTPQAFTLLAHCQMVVDAAHKELDRMNLKMNNTNSKYIHILK